MQAEEERSLANKQLSGAKKRAGHSKPGAVLNCEASSGDILLLHAPKNLHMPKVKRRLLSAFDRHKLALTGCSSTTKPCSVQSKLLNLFVTLMDNRRSFYVRSANRNRKVVAVSHQ